MLVRVPVLDLVIFILMIKERLLVEVHRGLNHEIRLDDFVDHWRKTLQPIILAAAKCPLTVVAIPDGY